MLSKKSCFNGLKSINKKTSDGAVKSEIISNQEMAKELQINYYKI